MISQSGMWGAISFAASIISTAPSAKLGAIRQLPRDRAAASRSASSCSWSRPVVPTTAWVSRSRHRRVFSNTVEGTVKSTTTSGLDVAQHLLQRSAERRVGAAHKLHVVRAFDGGADRLAHPARGARNRDADHD